MPIRPENRDRYPKEWTEIRQTILERDGHCCQWCGLPNKSINPRTGSGVVLTIAHVHDPAPENCEPDNLAALCQQCHLRHDLRYHMAMRGVNLRIKAVQDGQLPMFGFDEKEEVERARRLLGTGSAVLP